MVVHDEAAPAPQDRSVPPHEQDAVGGPVRGALAHAGLTTWAQVDALTDRSASDDEVAATVVDEGDKASAGDGLETDDQGRLYVTDGEHDAIHRRLPDGSWETVVHDPRLLWPDTMSVAADGHLYVTANQLYRQSKYQGGRDLRRYPYTLFRTRIDAGPVLLKP